ncbi:MAG: tetratricopeptide repeat protein [Bryobacteraceae bacterium]
MSAFLLLAATVSASPDVVGRAAVFYQHTDYAASLHVLAEDPAPDAAAFLLAGKNYYMLGDYKKAIDDFEKALALSPGNSDYELWLGRAWGQRAETGGWLTAGMSASKARQCFEKAVALDPRNHEAMNDLFDFYLNAPVILGGGIDKAEAIAKRIARERPPEYQFEEAQLADRQKQYGEAEMHFRRAMELAPGEPGRVVDLARYVAKRGRLEESDALFQQARKMAPNRPGIVFAEAHTYVENHRNLEQARTLLREYLRSNLTPDDPPRQAAEKLLRRAGG